MSYPAYSRAERIADGTVHVLGVGAAITAVSVLFRLLPDHLSPATITATAVYAAGLIAMLSASAAYHLAAYTRARALLRRLDHAAIYFKIAGTFTPLGVMLGTAFAYVVLGLVWILALAGATTKLLAAPGRMSTGWLPQVALGWSGALLILPLAALLPPVSLWLMIAGGGVYSLAVIFYCWDSLRYANAIWHGFVLVATGCFFAGIATALAASPV